MAASPDDPNVRAWASVKNSLGPPPPSLLYEIVDDGDGSKVQWLGTSESTADDLLRTTTGNAAPRLDSAVEMLRQLLADSPVLMQEVRRQAQRQGIGWRTVEKAKGDLGVRSQQRPEPGVRGPGPSWWFLPTSSGPTR